MCASNSKGLCGWVRFHHSTAANSSSRSLAPWTIWMPGVGVDNDIPLVPTVSCHRRPFCSPCACLGTKDCLSKRGVGVAYAFFGILAISPDAVLIRWMKELHGSMLQIVVWKTVGVALFSLLVAPANSGGWRKLRDRSRAAVRPCIMMAISNGLLTMGFTIALQLTSAARALLLTSLAPLWAAIIGWRFLGDDLPRRTLIALVCAIGSTLVTFLPRVLGARIAQTESAHAHAVDGATQVELVGDLVALATGGIMGTNFCLVRHVSRAHPAFPIPLIPLMGGAFLLTALVPGLYLSGGSLTGGLMPIFAAPVLLEGFCLGASYLCFYRAPRHISGAEVGLIALLEAFLGPLWVCAAFGDVPSTATLLGGSLLLLTLVAHEVRGLCIAKAEAKNEAEAKAEAAEIGESFACQ